MKKLFLLAAMFAVTLSVSAQHKMQVWQDGTPIEYTTTAIDSVTFLNITPSPEPPQTYTNGILPAVFAVSDSTYVQFSQGNLQYNAGNGRVHVCADYSLLQGTWRFARKQYDYIGEGNLRMSKDYNGWTDLFGWGTSGWNSGAVCYEPWSVSAEGTDYAPDKNSTNSLTQQYAFADWGVYNAISNGGDKPRIWRTLSAEEWKYLLMHCRWTMAKIKTGESFTLGLMLLPANFVCPAGLSMSATTPDNSTTFEWEFTTESYADNVYTEEQFALLESAGAVFMPCGGSRWETTSINTLGTFGLYWSTSVSDISSIATIAASLLQFNDTSVHATAGYRRSFGRSVRLVRDTVGYVPDTTTPSDALTGAFSVSADKQVRFSKGNLQYQANTKTWRFAEHQYGYIGSDNANISDTYTGWIDLFGWGTGNHPTYTNTDKNDYQTFVDWGNNTIGTDDPHIWRTLSGNEWYYIFYTRANAHKLFALGTVNGIRGTILLPDGWVAPNDILFAPSTEKGLSDQNGFYYNFNGDNYTHNTYTLSDWQKMESAGAVFLPAAGHRWGKDVYNVQNMGLYWSSITYDESNSQNLFFNGDDLSPQTKDNRGGGFSVRLVQNVK